MSDWLSVGSTTDDVEIRIDDSVWARLKAVQRDMSAGNYRASLLQLVRILNGDIIDEHALAMVHALLGLTLAELRHVEAAIDHLDHADGYLSSRGPSSPARLRVLHGLVIAHSHVGDLDVAESYLESFRAIAGDGPETTELTALLDYARGDYRSAQQHTEALIDDPHGSPLVELVRARTLNRRGEHAAVIDMWCDRGRRGDDERLLQEVAVAFEALGDVASAYRCERLAADVAESRMLTLSMLRELIDADLGRSGPRQQRWKAPAAPGDRFDASDATEAAMAQVQIEIDELRIMIDRAAQIAEHDAPSAQQLAAQLEEYVERMNRALETARNQSRASVGQATIPLKEIITRVCRSVDVLCAARAVTLRDQVDEDRPVDPSVQPLLYEEVRQVVEDCPIGSTVTLSDTGPGHAQPVAIQILDH